MAYRVIRGLRGVVNNIFLHQHYKTICNGFKISTRNYVSGMEKTAFEGKILRLIRNEIQYEFDYSSPSQPTPEFNDFKVDERPGEQFIRLSRKFGDTEEIKIEVTMFDGFVPVKKAGDSEDDTQLHITLIVDVYKGENSDILEFVCSAWPNSIEIRKVFTRQHDKMKGQPYCGPGFKDFDDEMQDSLYDFLEVRGIDDDLAVFLHVYMTNKDKIEYIRWMERLKSFIEKSGNLNSSRF